MSFHSFPRLNNKKGFTLIELLVVISIISLLSSIVFTSLSSARVRAAKVAGMEFASRMDRTIGLNTAVDIDFDEGTGTKVVNKSDGNQATAVGGPTWSTDTPTGIGYSMAFSGTQNINVYATGDGMNATNDGRAFTYAAWYEPRVVNPATGIYILNRSGYHSGITHSASGRLGCTQWFTDITNINIQYTTNVDAGRWYHVACTVDSLKKTITLYVNGNAVNKATYTTGKILYDYSAVPYTIGAFSSTYAADGNIDQVRVFTQSLVAQQVKDLYDATKAQFALK
ncbi:MAG: LamG domain-containing protein [Patescibacteria group bacterium]